MFNKQEAFGVVAIDDMALDKECIRLPSQYLQASFTASETRQRVESLRNQLKVHEAELAKAIRDKPEDYGLTKTTVAAIDERILTDEDFQAAKSRLIKAEHELELCSALVYAMDHKKKALGMLVELHCRSYGAEVKPSAETRAKFEEESERRVRTRARMPNPKRE